MLFPQLTRRGANSLARAIYTIPYVFPYLIVSQIWYWFCPFLVLVQIRFWYRFQIWYWYRFWYWFVAATGTKIGTGSLLSTGTVFGTGLGEIEAVITGGAVAFFGRNQVRLFQPLEGGYNRFSVEFCPCDDGRNGSAALAFFLVVEPGEREKDRLMAALAYLYCPRPLHCLDAHSAPALSRASSASNSAIRSVVVRYFTAR